ncbi:hypothetical protein H0H93_014990 [Arthromyces matolae]|nr:hypothetical protein H0H93_014990 [Arthromyces matolae]
MLLSFLPTYGWSVEQFSKSLQLSTAVRHNNILPMHFMVIALSLLGCGTSRPSFAIPVHPEIVDRELSSQNSMTSNVQIRDINAYESGSNIQRSIIVSEGLKGHMESLSRGIPEESRLFRRQVSIPTEDYFLAAEGVTRILDGLEIAYAFVGELKNAIVTCDFKRPFTKFEVQVAEVEDAKFALDKGLTFPHSPGQNISVKREKDKIIFTRGGKAVSIPIDIEGLPRDFYSTWEDGPSIREVPLHFRIPTLRSPRDPV